MEEIEIQQQPDWNPATQEAIKGEKRMSPLELSKKGKLKAEMVKRKRKKQIQARKKRIEG